MMCVDGGNDMKAIGPRQTACRLLPVQVPTKTVTDDDDDGDVDGALFHFILLTVSHFLPHTGIAPKAGVEHQPIQRTVVGRRHNGESVREVAVGRGGEVGGAYGSTAKNKYSVRKAHVGTDRRGRGN